VFILWRPGGFFSVYIPALSNLRFEAAFFVWYVPAGNSRLFSPPRAPPGPRLGLSRIMYSQALHFSQKNVPPTVLGIPVTPFEYG
jgi:hypothetical protein